MTLVTEAEEACQCGCECCAEEPKSKEQEVAELMSLRTRIEQRLSELQPEAV
ncbi:MAG: hypothetical protein ACRDIU_02730 [Actinomycetota bacterium]